MFLILKNYDWRVKTYAHGAVFILITSFLPTVTYAWSSKDLFLFRPVHQQAIDRVLSTKLEDKYRDLLKEQQKEVDNAQKAFQSYEHAMTGIEQSGKEINANKNGCLLPLNSKSLYICLSEQFIRSNLLSAIEAKKNESTLDNAFKFLGNAIHPLQDASSPVHIGFQDWRYDETIPEIADHVSRERLYPKDAKVKQRLEAAVSYAFDIYLEKQTMPSAFFDKNGGLIIPDVYFKN